MGNEQSAPKAKRGPIPDKFQTIEQVTAALREAGVESSSLILGIDYTKSNETSGMQSFQGRSLHLIDPSVGNPYQRVIEIIGRTLESFDDDRLIPAFGFGDVRTTNKSVFPLKPDGQPCNTFREVLSCYTAVTPGIRMSGPTNFGPLIRAAINVIKQDWKYHILVIIADGLVADEDDTARALVEASNYPLSIIMIGVGDGPFDLMHKFDDKLPRRRFDNFQFCEFNRAVSPSVTTNPDAYFAMNALMEVPEQYKRIKQLGLLSRQ